MKLYKPTALSNFILGLLFALGLLQLPMTELFSFFTYYDEAITIVSLLYIIAYISLSKQMPKKLFTMLMLIIVAFIIGCLSSLFSDIQQPLVAQIMDISYLFKLFICFIGADLFFSSRSDEKNQNLFDIVYLFVKALLAIAVILYLVGLSGTGNFFDTARYGLKSYAFIYGTAGMLSQYCIIFVPVIIAGCFVNNSNGVKWIYVALLIWASSLRVRAFAMILIVLILYIFIFKYQDLSMPVRNRIKSIFKPRYIIPIVILVAFIAKDQIFKYFSTLNSARAILLYYGVKIMIQYAPFGAGFASFCTEAAARYYSPLYSRYGISSFWGLKKGGTELTDGYWPAIFAELGIAGTIVMAILIFVTSFYMLEKSANNKWLFFSTLVFVLAIFISSTATGSYSSYTNTVFVTIVAMIINLKGDKYSNG